MVVDPSRSGGSLACMETRVLVGRQHFSQCHPPWKVMPLAVKTLVGP